MNANRHQQKRRLDRRNAIKYQDYDASPSESSSFDDHSPISPFIIDRTSFRIKGIDGEFDQICRSLGLSGPEDFAIPAAAWEARKSRSPSDNSSSSRFRNFNTSEGYGVSEPIKDGLSDAVETNLRVSGKIKHEAELVLLKNGLDQEKIENRVIKTEDVRSVDDEFDQLNVVRNRLSVRSHRDGRCGIKGARPPILNPPPGMSPYVADNISSTWDILKSFGPQDNRELPVSHQDDLDSPCLRDSIVISESLSDTSNDDEDNDSFNAAAIRPYNSIGPSNLSIKSWQKGDFLGSGSFGTVYEGFTDDGLFFAVKEVSLLDQGSRGKQSIYQLEQEISLLSQFEHENIVRYYGTDKDDSKLYIFLELVTKGSLANLYQKYDLRDTQVSAYTRQILNGLSYLHGRNVVHRDIKCANMLVDASGSVKLADFGLAKATTLNDLMSCKGTAFWMAPEVVNRKGHGYGLAADIWSLGCTVLEMLTCQIPYSHLEGMQALFRIGKGELPLIPNSLSSDAKDFILKCLRVNPADRPTAVQLLCHPFVKMPPSMILTPSSLCHHGTATSNN
ncbi:Mitogen-activated protein kinase kinase kinase [Bertholletia excelsa]